MKKYILLLLISSLCVPVGAMDRIKASAKKMEEQAKIQANAAAIMAGVKRTCDIENAKHRNDFFNKDVAKWPQYELKFKDSTFMYEKDAAREGQYVWRCSGSQESLDEIVKSHLDSPADRIASFKPADGDTSEILCSKGEKGECALSLTVNRRVSGKQPCTVRYEACYRGKIKGIFNNLETAHYCKGAENDLLTSFSVTSRVPVAIPVETVAVAPITAAVVAATTSTAATAPVTTATASTAAAVSTTAHRVPLSHQPDAQQSSWLSPSWQKAVAFAVVTALFVRRYQEPIKKSVAKLLAGAQKVKIAKK